MLPASGGNLSGGCNSAGSTSYDLISSGILLELNFFKVHFIGWSPTAHTAGSVHTLDIRQYLATCCQVRPDPVTMVPTEQLEEVARDWVRAVTGLQVDTVPQFIQLLRAEDDTGFKLAR